MAGPESLLLLFFPAWVALVVRCLNGYLGKCINLFFLVIELEAIESNARDLRAAQGLVRLTFRSEGKRSERLRTRRERG